MLTYDPRTVSTQVYEALKHVRDASANSPDVLKEQKVQAVGLYAYAATWGILRLKAEESALQNQANKQRIIRCFFQVLEKIAYPEQPNHLGKQGLENLANQQRLSASEYLGLIGLSLQIAREFAFWAEALYPKENTTSSNAEKE